MDPTTEPFVEISGEALTKFFEKFGQEDETKLFQLKVLAEVYNSIDVPDKIRRKLYAHKDPNVGILFSIIKYPTALPGDLYVQNMQIYCHHSNTGELESAFERTAVVDFGCYTMINNVDVSIISAMEKVAKARNVACNNWGSFSVVKISLEKALENQKSNNCPSEVYIRSLTKEEALVPYKSWRYYFSQTLEHFEAQVVALPSAGVFLKENDQLVAWMLLTDQGNEGFFYTRKAYRGKGYGKLVLNAFSGILAEKNITPAATVESYNKVSFSCFQSLGFENFVQTYVLVFVPHNFPLGVEDFQKIIGALEEY